MDPRLRRGLLVLGGLFGCGLLLYLGAVVVFFVLVSTTGLFH